ncbi:hypothetical protein [Burkholderia cenocepacia]|uniref:hypothetical protein n=1 Tax=Burkholderia cenocepacia TaxID=95486 RepID=UPI002861E1A9|nr:hypothetical protein [Burkholderia cenocepacia]MDR8057698.1 hypothetical protein [Burkholderia cenocepacia]MDR8062210.1 hypothetical protein [Burkholderia cenocepacia]
MTTTDLRALLRDFRLNDRPPHTWDDEDVVLIRSIVAGLQTHAARERDPSRYQAWLVDQVGVPKTAATAIAVELHPLLDDAHALLRLVHSAIADGSDGSLAAVRAFRESADADDLVHRRRAYAALGPRFNAARWHDTVASIRHVATRLRATLLALVETYCETGWAAHDLLPRAAGDQAASPGEHALRAALERPDASAFEVVEAFDRRTQELGVAIRLTHRFVVVEGVAMVWFFAATDRPWTCSITAGSLNPEDVLDVAMPCAPDAHDPEPRLVVASVTPEPAHRLDRATDFDLGRRFSTVQGALSYGRLAWNSPGTDDPTVFRRASFRTYSAALVPSVAPDDSARDFVKALGEDPDVRDAINALPIVADGFVVQAAHQGALDHVLLADLRVVGAVSPWQDVERLSPAERFERASERVVRATQALADAIVRDFFAFADVRDEEQGYRPSAAGVASQVLTHAVRALAHAPQMEGEALTQLRALQPAADTLGEAWDRLARGTLRWELERAMKDAEEPRLDPEDVHRQLPEAVTTGYADQAAGLEPNARLRNDTPCA